MLLVCGAQWQIVCFALILVIWYDSNHGKWLPFNHKVSRRAKSTLITVNCKTNEPTAESMQLDVIALAHSMWNWSISFNLSFYLNLIVFKSKSRLKVMTWHGMGKWFYENLRANAIDFGIHLVLFAFRPHPPFPFPFRHYMLSCQ